MVSEKALLVINCTQFYVLNKWIKGYRSKDVDLLITNVKDNLKKSYLEEQGFWLLLITRVSFSGKCLYMNVSGTKSGRWGSSWRSSGNSRSRKWSAASLGSSVEIPFPSKYLNRESFPLRFSGNRTWFTVFSRTKLPSSDKSNILLVLCFLMTDLQLLSFFLGSNLYYCQNVCTTSCKNILTRLERF